ncbi:Late embryogenesis abundant protein ECP63 [Glycine max]|nr:hypothetical protein JHK85_054862 [Glycine max]KAH1195313.1 Late embryogenesis abundant protein ECP63 [Glycine max]
MASRRQFKEERAEAAAKLAAKDIGDINRANERDEGYDLRNEANFKKARAEAAAKLAAKDLEDANRLRDSTLINTTCHDHDENKPGLIGSMLRAAKEAVVGKPHHDEVDNSSGVYEKAKETKVDAAGSKMGEYADYATQKARETKQKAKEAKDYAADKAKDAKDTTVQTAAKRAIGFFSGGNKDQTKEEEETSRRMQEVRVQDKEYGTGRGGEKLVIKMEESRPGAVADALKAANKAMDGVMEEEGVLHVERRREKI